MHLDSNGRVKLFNPETRGLACEFEWVKTEAEKQQPIVTIVNESVMQIGSNQTATSEREREKWRGWWWVKE